MSSDRTSSLHKVQERRLDVAQRVAERVRVESETRVAVEVDAYFASRLSAIIVNERVEFDRAVDT